MIFMNFREKTAKRKQKLDGHNSSFPFLNLAYSLVIDNYDIIGHNSDLDKNILYLEILNETNESIL